MLLRITFIKQFVLFCLSFTDNPDYKIAYVELWGVIIGSFIAIYGTLWAQKKIDEKEKQEEYAKYACVVYYDIYFSCKELIKLFEDTKSKFCLDAINAEDAVDKLCQTAMGRNLLYNSNWIVDVAQLTTVLTEVEIKHIYKCYEKLENINRAFHSNNWCDVKKIYIKDICWLVSGDEKNLHNDIHIVLDKLMSLIKKT